MLKSKLTPLLRQYLEIKEKHNDCLIFFRLGDFYELFFEDAKVAAKCLNITLTKRGQIDGTDIPMCGVPHHQGENYLTRLIRNGFKVAICEQIETPEESKKRGYKEIIKRKVVRIASPGTLTEEKELTLSDNNFLMGVLLYENNYNIVYSDISTGEVNLKKCFNENEVLSFIEDISPSEILIPNNSSYEFIFKKENKFNNVTHFKKSFMDFNYAKECLIKTYSSNKKFNILNFAKEDIIALGTLISYIMFTQNGRLPVLSLPNSKENSDYLEIDNATKRNLEIKKTLNGEKEGSLFNSLDFTFTSNGSRKLLSDISNPLKCHKKINKRLEYVKFFYVNFDFFKEDIIDSISNFPDISRSLNRLNFGRGGPRDLYSIYKGLQKALKIYDILNKNNKLHNPFNEFLSLIDKNSKVIKLIELLEKSLNEKLPISSKEGNFIRSGFDAELDEIRSYRDNARKLILSQEEEEKKITGISNLKIKYNNFLGYFLDVSSSNNKKVKAIESRYIHRQTLKNSYRYTTKKLVEVSENILNANHKLQEIENKIYARLVENITSISNVILMLSDMIARIDVSISWVRYAKKYNAVEPKIDNTNIFKIVNGRHPSVEKTHMESFISNSCILNEKENNIFKLITGPNMSGKSTYLRQNALILVMAQSGGYCPAESVNIGICDKLFCRLGSGDELAKGNSTFMVEMIETANILNSASDRSLVVLDEIGRGTSTFDGMSLAWAIIEYLIEKIKCKTLFATHYNELSQLKKKYNQIKLNTFKVKEWENELIFLHELIEGVAESSYGIQVAKMAGIPNQVTLEAKKILKNLENKTVASNKKNNQTLIDFELKQNDTFVKDLKENISSINLNNITPIEALNVLEKIKKQFLKNLNKDNL